MWQKANRVNLLDITEIPSPHFVEVGGLKIAYRTFGHGKQLLCLPPWPAPSLVYLPLGLAIGEHFQLVTLDLPSWGGNSDRMIWNATITNYARVVEEFIDKIGLDDPYLLGYSYGGALAQAMISLHKISPKKLVLVSTIHSGDEILARAKPWLKLYSLIKPLPISSKVAMKTLYASMKHNLEKGPYFRQYANSYICKALEPEYMKGDIDDIINSIVDIASKDFINHFRKTTETLVLYADHDMSFIRSETAEIAHKLGIEPVSIEGADHDHFFFDVNKSADVILNFLLS